MSKGPLAVRLRRLRRTSRPRPGAVEHVRLQVENAGTVAWRDGMGISVAYHWLDGRGNPIVWDGLRTPAPPLAPGDRGDGRAARARTDPARARYRLAFDMVAENRAWFSELGSEQLRARRRRRAARRASRASTFPTGSTRRRTGPTVSRRRTPRATRSSRVRSSGRALHRPRALAPYIPGSGRDAGFASPLLCPSVLPGFALEPLEEVAGLPAFAPPTGEPWVYDGRIVLPSTARPRSGRRPT